MYSPVKYIYLYIYIYRQMVDVYVFVCTCVRTLLSIYISKMSGRDHENLTTN